MPFENKILRLIAGVNTRKKMRALLEYFKEHNVKLNDQQLRTALNKFSILPKEDDDATT